MKERTKKRIEIAASLGIIVAGLFVAFFGATLFGQTYESVYSHVGEPANLQEMQAYTTAIIAMAIGSWIMLKGYFFQLSETEKQKREA